MPLPRGLERKGTWPYLSLPVVAESGSHNLDAPPTWRAKDVGGYQPPRAPMGTEPLVGSAGARMHKEQIEATHTHNNFTQLRAAWRRKTLLLHVWLIGVLALERKKLQRVGAGRRRGSTGRPA